MSVEAGQSLSHYRLIEKIGEGGMGVVWKAVDTRLDREVAIKVLPETLARDSERRARFEREAKAVAKLAHPNILEIWDFGTDQGVLYAVTELLDGETLSERLERGPIPWREAAEIGAAVAGGLAAAHHAGVIHRDVKPSNLFLNSDGRVKILDFGLARHDTAKVAGDMTDASTRTSHTDPGTVLGTVGYMSPEQVRGDPADHRSDIFSLGCVLYEMVSGGRTFARDTSAETMTAILKEEPTQLSATASALPPELERTTLRCLEKNPGKRFQSAQDLSFTLRSLSSGPSRAMPAVEETEDEESRSSIAVLPFTNLSADPEQEYFCDGMTEEIISALCHIPNLRVIARSSCFALKGKHRDVREVGKRLGAETLLEGSVRKIGTRLRITTQLVNVQDASHLWSRRFDREMEDVFAIQDEIAQSIVEALQFRLVSDEGGDGEQAIKLAEGEKADLVKRYTDDVEAYNSYLKGRYHWNRRTGDGLRRAIEYFEEAIDRDPEYALAHAGLADSFFVLPYYSSFPPRVAYPRAKRSALRALEIDGSLAECHTSLGLAKSMYDWDWEGAEAEFRTALELDPRYPIAHFWYGWFFLFQGQYEEAIARMNQALELEPLSSLILCDLGVAQFSAIPTCSSGGSTSSWRNRKRRLRSSGKRGRSREVGIRASSKPGSEWRSLGWASTAGLRRSWMKWRSCRSIRTSRPITSAC
jgi:serine/threonine protein kinase/tetratricopeptide (TPR) repeat protein